jgi:hypothetical protein
MERERLLATLEELQAEVQRTGEIHPDTRRALHDVARQIERQLAEQSASGSEAPPAAGTLQDLLREFDAEHPELARWIRQVSEALASLGI